MTASMASTGTASTTRLLPGSTAASSVSPPSMMPISMPRAIRHVIPIAGKMVLVKPPALRAAASEPPISPSPTINNWIRRAYSHPELHGVAD